MQPYDISVIIPTYNVEEFIEEALNSIVQQSFTGHVEILLIDDCSTDGTKNIIEEYKNNHPQLPIRILYQEKNMRQGTARNRGIREAKGKYVFFLDGDDFLDSMAFEKMFEKAETRMCDFVLCDWAYFYEDKGLMYVNNEKFLFTDFLEGEDCEQLLEAHTYFSVNKLYNREFLLKNDITYGEGYIYEDYEFYVDVAQKAQIIGIVQNPYYRVRVNENSTTKANRKSKVHIESLLKAVDSTIGKFNPRGRESYYHLYKYIIKKTMNYIRFRAPYGMKRKTVKRIVGILNKRARDYYVPRKVTPLFYFYFRRRYVQDAQINKMIMIDHLHHKGLLNPAFTRIMTLKKLVLKNKTAAKLNKKRLINKKQKVINQLKEQKIKDNVVLFLGFDYRYVGNSKYLFDYVVKNNEQKIAYYFVTKNRSIPSRYRLDPRSIKFYKILYRAKVVIAESWVPLDFEKKEGQTWIQLWHGTPFKKLFFDSHEKYISQYNRNHKRNKQKDIAKWDYLLSDSIVASEKFASAFAYDQNRILQYGYPRVQWLKEHHQNEGLKQAIKEKIKIPENKKVLLYVPTWRDYNYRNANPNLDYLVDLERLSHSLSDEYVILNKEHSMDRFKVSSPSIITPDDSIDVQHLILISDVIISDFSSIIFDGIAIDIPFYLYINDFDLYEEARGVYEDMSEQLKDFYVNDMDKLIHRIRYKDTDYPVESYAYVKQILANVSDENSCKKLQGKILELTKDKVV